MSSWQVNEARNHWSEVLDQAEKDGPQVITHHGRQRAVVLSMDTYRSLEAKRPDLVSFLLYGPKPGLDDFEVERDHASSDREIDL